MAGRTTLKLALVWCLAYGSLSWAEGLVGPLPLPSDAGAPGCCRGPLPCPPPLPPPPVALPPADPPVPIVTVKVRVPACAAAGEDIEYRICVENCSPADAHHVIVRNPLPVNARFVRASPEPTQTKPELQWDLGTMHGGERRQIVLVLAPTNMEDVVSCARVQFEHGQCVTTRLARGRPHMPGTDGEVPPFPPGDGRLKLTMSGPKESYANLDAQYFLTVANTGTTRATNVLVTAQVPQEMTFRSAAADGRFMEGQVAWLLGDLAPGERRTVAVTLRARKAGEFCVRGRALADRGLTDLAEVCTTFRGVAAMHPELVDRKNPLAIGEEGNYLIKFVNQSGEPINNIRVKASLSDALVFVQAKGVDVKLSDKKPDGSQSFGFEIKALAPNATVEVEIITKGVRAGEGRFKYEATADRFEGGAITQENSTTIFADPPRKE